MVKYRIKYARARCYCRSRLRRWSRAHHVILAFFNGGQHYSKLKLRSTLGTAVSMMHDFNISAILDVLYYVYCTACTVLYSPDLKYTPLN
eukprot:jgi/Botrbrau1/2495/Bobra.0226s0051.1